MELDMSVDIISKGHEEDNENEPINDSSDSDDDDSDD